MKRFRVTFIFFIVALLYNLFSFNYGVKALETSSNVLVCLDSLANNSKVTTNVTLEGWAIGKNGISDVNILVDGQLVGKAQTGIIRYDVWSVYPEYKDSHISGYKYVLDINNIKPGVHILTIQAIGIDGIEGRTSININVVKPAPLTVADTLKANGVYNSNIPVEGWALNSSGISEVNILIDGQLAGKAQTGLIRYDVWSAFPQYKDSHLSGYKYLLDINKIKPGTHTITVQAVGVDKSEGRLNTVIQVVKLPPLMSVDTLKSNSKYNSNIPIEGWALNSSGVSEINILIDGQLTGKAQTGLTRYDVWSAFPQYKDSQLSGYKYLLDITTIKPGIHSITVQAVGIDGTESRVNTNIEIVKLAPLTAVDSPRSNNKYSSEISVEGWALNGSGISEINILVDGQVTGKAQTGLIRYDVWSAFPQYKDSHLSGYKYILDINTIMPGFHTITVQAVGLDGTENRQNINLEIVKPIPLSNIESLLNYDIRKNNILVEGWSINHSGVARVNVYLDNILDGNAQIGIERYDVWSAFPNYRDSHLSGFRYYLDSTKIKNGLHNIKVVATGVDGTTSNDSRVVDIENDSIVYTDYSKSFDESLDIQVSVGAQTDKTGSWTSATRDDISYYLNPSNFADSYGIYQFLKLNFTYGVSADDLNRLLAGKGILNGKGQVFLDAAKANNISPIYLVSHALLETGNGTSALSNGILVNQTNKLIVVTDKDTNGNVIGRHVELNPIPTIVEPKVSFNIFGIRAYDYTPRELNSPEVFASEYAYSQGWFTVDDAIRGGAKWIADGYINSSTYKQNTLYKMRWNPQTPGTHQYASDIGWSYKQVYNIKKLIDQCPNAVLVFDVPRYREATLAKTIVLDAGHGGDDGGATGNGYEEANLNLQVVEKLGAKLQALGYNVLYTRNPGQDITVSLEDRAKFANDINADLFISVHHDASDTSSTANGTSTHYSSFRPAIETSGAYITLGGIRYTVVKEVAGTVYYLDGSVTKTASINNVTVLDATPSEAAVDSKVLADSLVNALSSLGVTNRGSSDHNLYVTRWTTMPSVLIEMGFVSNPDEIKKIADPVYQDNAAQQIANTIYNFFNNK